MKGIIRHLLLILAMFTTFAPHTHAQYAVSSPNEKINVTIMVRRKADKSKFSQPYRYTLDVVQNRKSILKQSEIGLTVKSQGKRYRFAKSEITKVVTNTSYEPDSLKSAWLYDLSGKFNYMRIETSSHIDLEIRAYNNGVAYRFIVSQYPEEFKILELAGVFPDESHIADAGTYMGNYIMNWHTLSLDPSLAQQPEDIPHESYRRIIPWNDALQSFSIGSNINIYSGDLWKDVAKDFGITADYTYKYLYTGMSFTPCYELMYILYDRSYYPFENVVGSIHGWTISPKLGISIPIQIGYNIINVSPYLACSYLHLTQHGTTFPGFSPLSSHHRYLLGPGIKLQFAVREQFSLGINYEYQYFLSDKSPSHKQVLGLSLGYMF